MSWVSPTGYNDPNNKWTSESKAYDEDLDPAAAAECLIRAGEWGGFLELTHTAIVSNKVRFYAYYSLMGISKIDLDVYKDGVWVHVYEGSYLHRAWVEKTFPQGNVTKARVRFYNSAATTRTAGVYEFDFWQVIAIGVTYDLTIYKVARGTTAPKPG
ncbi:unnamed protein product, partial [marine sediment metagenome]